MIAAGPMFFAGAWVLMIFAGIVYQDVGIRPFGYATSMLVTIGLWLTLGRRWSGSCRPGKQKK